MERSLADVLTEQGWEPGPIVGWRKEKRTVFLDLEDRGLELYEVGELAASATVADDRVAVDVLCALRVLPPELSSMHEAGRLSVPPIVAAIDDAAAFGASAPWEPGERAAMLARASEFGPDRDGDRGAFHSRDYSAPEIAPVPAGVDGTALGTRGAP